MTDILDKSYDNDTGEITQFLVMDGAEPVTKKATPENLLLYDPEDELPFDGGMKQFLSGDGALKLSADVLVAQSGNEYSYLLSVNDSVVETTPNQAEEFLQSLYDSISSDSMQPLRAFHAKVIKNQVRRNIVNVLKQTFEQSNRIEITASGWLVDNFYLVDWNAKMYTANDDRDEDDYVRSGGTVKKDKSYEFVRLRHDIGSFDPIEISFDGSSYTLTEREMLFLSKVKWLLHRRHYHPDKPFWQFADRWADVSVEDGTPDNSEPNLDVFDI
jgi:hypothetical protein